MSTSIHTSKYIRCECVYLLFNVCNDGIEMEAMLTNANGMVQYRLKEHKNARR
jgi:hypothetical protein